MNPALLTLEQATELFYYWEIVPDEIALKTAYEFYLELKQIAHDLPDEILLDLYAIDSSYYHNIRSHGEIAQYNNHSPKTIAILASLWTARDFY